MKKGFTLVELMIAVTLMVVAIGITADILITLSRTFGKAQITTELEQQSSFVTAKLEKELRTASRLITPAGGTNTLEFQLTSGDTITYTVDTTNKVINRRLHNGTTDITEPLTYNGFGGVYVNCATHCFNVITGSPQIVSYTFEFAQVTPVETAAKAEKLVLSNQIVLRNTYFSH